MVLQYAAKVDSRRREVARRFAKLAELNAEERVESSRSCCNLA